MKIQNSSKGAQQRSFLIMGLLSATVLMFGLAFGVFGDGFMMAAIFILIIALVALSYNHVKKGVKKVLFVTVEDATTFFAWVLVAFFVFGALVSVWNYAVESGFFKDGSALGGAAAIFLVAVLLGVFWFLTSKAIKTQGKLYRVLLTLLWFVVSVPIGFVVGVAVGTLLADPGQDASAAVRYGGRVAWIFAGVTTWVLWALLKKIKPTTVVVVEDHGYQQPDNRPRWKDITPEPEKLGGKKRF